MLDIFAQFATNETLENEGVWVPHGTAKFLIARAGNRKYSKMLTSEVDKNDRLLKIKGDESDKLSEEIMVKVYAETILLGWEKVAYKGKEMKYSKENACTLLSHKDFRRLIAQLSDDVENYRAKEEDAQQKN